MLPLKSAILVGAVMLLAGSAHAQIGRIQLNSGAQQENAVRVQSGINLFIPGPTGEGDEAQKLRDKAQHAVYEMAGRECDLLREVLAKDCRLESVTVNINANARQYNQQQPEGLSVSGAINLQITLK
jgi:hypothetical protein